MSGKFEEPSILDQTTKHPKAKVRPKGAKKAVVKSPEEDKNETVEIKPVEKVNSKKPEVAEPEPVVEASSSKPAPKAKVKRVMSEKQLEALAKGREARALKLAQKKEIAQTA